MKITLTKVFRSLLLCPALFCCTHTANAQVFNLATQSEYTYPPTPGPVTTTSHSFTYTMSHISYMTNNPTPPPTLPYLPAPAGLPQSDLTVHTWDDAGVQSGIAYLNTATGSGTPAPAASIYDQGFIPYPNSRDLEVSLLQDECGQAFYDWGTNAPWWVIVSYYYSGPKNNLHPGGPGHYFDAYIWNQPTPNGTGGLTLQYTRQLSFVSHFTRISQDGHNTYCFCITWEDPKPGINFIYGFMPKSIPGGPQISPIYNIAGTIGETNPDVAYTHFGAAGVTAQFLYYRQVSGGVRITEASIPMQFGPPWVAVPPPAINDVNFIPYQCDVLDLKTRIDAPDHNTDNWAYTYVLPLNCVNNTDVFVRFNNGGTKTTYNVTDGSMGNLPCDMDPYSVPYINDWPVCSFDVNYNWLNVEWYTQYAYPSGFFAPNVGGYVGIQMDNTGALISTPDYLQVGEFTSLSNTLASATPTIASSRQNDRTDYQFAAFANADPSAPGNEMIVKDRLWSVPSFKGGAASQNIAALYKTNVTAGNADNFAVAFPNPFADKFSLNLSAGLWDQDLSVTVTDISGKTIGTVSGKGNSLNASLNGMSTQLPEGTYLVKARSLEGDFQKVLKVEKVSKD